MICGLKALSQLNLASLTACRTLTDYSRSHVFSCSYGFSSLILNVFTGSNQSTYTHRTNYLLSPVAVWGLCDQNTEMRSCQIPPASPPPPNRKLLMTLKSDFSPEAVSSVLRTSSSDTWTPTTYLYAGYWLSVVGFSTSPNGLLILGGMINWFDSTWNYLLLLSFQLRCEFVKINWAWCHFLLTNCHIAWFSVDIVPTERMIVL